MKTMIRQSYSAGFHTGVQWAENDRRDHAPSSEGIALLREESQTDQRWARAFYLGALRGYRESTRTLRDGRWGA